MSGILQAFLTSTAPLAASIQAGETLADTTANKTFPTNTVTIRGGVPPYTQVWSWAGIAGSGTLTFSGSSTAVTVTPLATGVSSGLSVTGNLSCTVTDALSNVATSSPSAYEYERI